MSNQDLIKNLIQTVNILREEKTNLVIELSRLNALDIEGEIEAKKKWLNGLDKKITDFNNYIDKLKRA